MGHNCFVELVFDYSGSAVGGAWEKELGIVEQYLGWVHEHTASEVAGFGIVQGHYYSAGNYGDERKVMHSYCKVGFEESLDCFQCSAGVVEVG